MKNGLLLIICLVIQQNKVNGQTLPELLKNAQSKTDELHSFITSILLKFRMEMSNILTGIVNESLSHILKALEASQLTDVPYTSDEMDGDSERVGKQISRCSALADSDIQTAIKQFFIVFNPIHDQSLIVLNTVLQQIVEWNNTGDPSDFVGRVHGVLEGKSDEFVSTVVPALEDELRKFKSVLLLIPSTSYCSLGRTFFMYVAHIIQE